MHRILNGDCLVVLQEMPDNSVDLIVTDPPYFRVKSEEWDRQWATPSEFVAWIGKLAEHWQRVLKPNGSLYVFASSQMSARVEIAIAEHFNVLNRIVWAKGAGGKKHGRWSSASKEALRSYFPETEYIIFAEHYEADNIAKGEAGYAAKCDELRGFVFEPLRKYLDDERKRAGFKPEQVGEILGSFMYHHYFSVSQWTLPTEDAYLKMRYGFNRANNSGEYLRREYEYLRREYKDLRGEYEYLRREYEDLRRPFGVSVEVPYTDVWMFSPVAAYSGKHVCEKPLDMMKHIVSASTKPGAHVLDCFMGSGSAGIAALSLGRSFTGIEIDAQWCERARVRIEAQQAEISFSEAFP